MGRLLIRASGGLLWMRQWTFAFHKMRGISWLAAGLLGLFHTGDWVEGDLSHRDRRLASRAPTTTRNLSPWRQTYSPYHLWKWTLSTVLELEEIIAVWVRRDLKKTKNIRKMWVQPIICDRRDNGLFWTIFEDLSVDSWRTVWGNSVFVQKKKTQIWRNLYHPETDQQQHSGSHSLLINHLY